MSTQICYTRSNSTVSDGGGQVPCGTGSGVQHCCAQGDTCGEDGFCHFTHQLSQTVTGYYLGGCTSSAFTDAACPQHCTSFLTQDVIYNATTGLWRCCWGSGSLDCSVPSQEAFDAPAAAQLFAVSSSSTASTSTSTASSTSSSTSASRTSLSASVTSSSTSATSSAATTSTSAQTSASAAADSSSSGSSSSSTLVPAIVVPIVVVLAALAVGLWLWRRRRARAPKPLEYGQGGYGIHEVGTPEQAMSEMPANPSQRTELDAKNPPIELHG